MIKSPLIKTCLLSVFSIFCFFSTIHGQGRYLDVPLIGQLGEQLCWAASMEMIDKYYGGSLTQCDFAKQYYFYENSGSHSTLSCQNDCWSIPDKLNKIIENYPRHPDKYDSPHYFDMLFNYFGYNSMEDIEVNRVNWLQIMNEINACKPFLIVLNKINPLIKWNYPHALVVKGYHLLSGGSLYIIANDPQNSVGSCKGCQYLLPISIFSMTYDKFNAVSEIVRGIIPKEKNICERCENIISSDNNELVQLAEQSNFLTTTSQFAISASTLQSLNPIDIIYTDLNSFTQKTVKYVIDTSPTHHLGIYLEEDGNNWGIRGISKVDCTVFDSNIIPKLFVLKDKSIETTNISYTVLLPYNIEFYKIEFNGEIFLSPIRDYSETELGYRYQHLYPEKEVYKRLTQFFAKKPFKEESKSK